MVKVTERSMENTAENCRRFPPRSKFNDEESTGVLRLIVEQERLLNNPVNPVLNITSDKLKRLPPLSDKLQDRNAALDNHAFEPQRSHRRPTPNSDKVLSRPTLLRGTLGRPKIPEIYSTPKMASPRGRKRPRASYGRHTEIPSNDAEAIVRGKSVQEYTSDSTNEFLLDRPSNPTPMKETGNLINQGKETRTINSRGFDYESDEDFLDVEEEAYASYIN